MDNSRVQLEWALQWRCPRCRIVSYTSVPFVTDESEEFLREEGILESWEVLDGEDDAGHILFMMVPSSVACPRCNIAYETDLPRGMTEFGVDDPEDTEEW
jgi:phage FluMu protein Com